MKRFIVALAVLVFSTISFGAEYSVTAGTTNDCVFENGDKIANCEVVFGSNGENPNVYVHWNNPTSRKDGTTMNDGELSHSKIYFQKISINHWTQYNTQRPETAAVFIYKEPETYSILMTAVNQLGLEADGNDPIVFEVTTAPTEPPIDPPVEPPVTPPMAPVLFDIPDGATTGTIMFGTGEVQ